MESYIKFTWGIILVLITSVTTIAQDVRINIPIENIINNTEFSISLPVMNTGSNKKWLNMHPTIWSLKNEFENQTSNVTLSSSILQYQLDNIGGQPPKFHNHDNLPGFQHFTTSPQTWYVFHSPNASQYTPGNIVFKFKIPASAFENNAFIPGEYAITVNHNYASGTHPYFTPASFQIILVVPFTTPIKWNSHNTSVTHEISSLNAFRAATGRQIPIGTTQIFNTVNFNLWGKTNGPIQVTSSHVDPFPISPQHIKLGSANSSKISTFPLSDAWKNYTPNGPFTVIPGNVNTFDLNFSIDHLALKTHFFKAGTYTFQLNLGAISTDNTVSSSQNTDVTINVLPLSEINISSGQEVNFYFNTALDYQQGKSKIMPDHIKLSNNENFELYVKAGTSSFKKAGVQSDIDSNILQVGIDGVSSTPLSISPQKIISAGAPVLDGELDIKYNISPTAAQSLVGKEKTTYSIDVIYSFTAL